MIRCPRCNREVADTEVGRKAHGTSCVRIPEKRSADWGVKTRKGLDTLSAAHLEE